MSESVNHPSHYNSGKIEVIEAIEDWRLDFHLGNAVKYVSRAGKKNPAKYVEDLEKAIWYIKRKIEVIQAGDQKRDPIRPNDMNPRAERGHGNLTDFFLARGISEYKLTDEGGKWLTVWTPEKMSEDDGEAFLSLFPNGKPITFCWGKP